MASQKQLDKWYNEAVKINSNPEYVHAYVEYRQKAKRADQRLVELEALQHEKHFEGVLEYAYKGAIRDIQSWRKEGQRGGEKRFNTAPPTKLTELQAKISDIDKFLAKPTSSKRQIVKFYKSRAKTFNKGRIKNGQSLGGFGKEFDVEFTWQDIANYYEDKKGQREAVKLASKTEVRALAVLKRIATDKDLQDIQNTREKIEKVTGRDKILAKEVERLLNQGLNYENLMGDN